MASRVDQIELAKLAEKAERYPDMLIAMKRAVEQNSQLTVEERQLLSAAYRNVIGALRRSWRTISAMQEQSESPARTRQLARKYLQKIADELTDTSRELLTLLDRDLIPSASSVESEVSYMKMKGDCYRYLAEINTGNQRQEIAQDAEHAYETAYDRARELHILDQPDAAHRLAKQAFDDALAKLDNLDGDAYKASTLVLQLILDNLNLWSSEQAPVTNADGSEN